MIREIIKPTTTNKYGRYFLSIEAPGDEEDPASPIKPNTKVITVKPNNRSRKDFTDGAEIPEEPLDDMGTTTDDGQDYTADAGDTTGEEVPQEGDQPPVEDQSSEQPMDDTTVDTTDTGVPSDGTDVPVDTDQNTTPENQDVSVSDPENPDANVEVNTDDPNSPDVEDTTDYTADAGDDSSPDTDDGQDYTADAGDTTGEEVPQGGDQQAQPAAPRGPGLEYDSTRKYNLFENYISLANALKNYISKFEALIGDDQNENALMKIATEKLREIYDLCYDYMTMKFEISTYVQSLLFFQNLVVMVQMVFDMVLKTQKKY